MNLKSISVLTVGDRTLFVGDSRQGVIWAIQLPIVEPTQQQTFNLKQIDRELANFFTVTPSDLTITAIAVDRSTQAVYLGVSIGYGERSQAEIVNVEPNGTIKRLDLATMTVSQFNLETIPDERTLFWETTPARSLTITDIKYTNGEIYVAGLSNAEFASTLYRISYPFTAQAQASSIEIYHAVHNQNETRAPIRALAPIELNGTNYILAAYTCTPLVTIPVSELSSGAHVKGKTIAELGYGNAPRQILPFQAMGETGPESYVLITHKSREAMVFRVSDIAASQLEPGMSSPVQLPQQTTAGVGFTTIPLTGVVSIADFDEQFFVVVRRDADTGYLELVSVRKGAYFRLSDFINEYDFADYRYPENDPFQQNYVRPMQHQLRTDEGYAHLNR